MNWLMFGGMVCLAIGIIKHLGWITGGVLLIMVAILIELW